MRIAAIAIATADLGSDGGVIDGCARVHWRGRAMFPAAGDGSGTFVYCACGMSQIYTYVPKVRFSGGVPLVGFYPVALVILAACLQFRRSVSPWESHAPRVGLTWVANPREAALRYSVASLL